MEKLIFDICWKMLMSDKKLCMLAILRLGTMTERYIEAKNFIYHVPKPIQVPKNTHVAFVDFLYVCYVCIICMYSMYVFDVCFLCI